MTRLATVLFLFAFGSLMLSSCQNQPGTPENTTTYECPMHCEGDKTYTEEGSCPVCKMDLVPSTSIEEPIKDTTASLEDEELSLYNLTSEWKTQENEDFMWADMKGKPFVLTMIYTTCQAACPRLVADMKFIAEDIDSKEMNYVLVSIDPENDTPEKLQQYAKENELGEQWTLLHGSKDDVRELSNVVAVKYMRISPLDFSHSNIISLFDENGVMQYQQEGLGVSNDKLVEKAGTLIN